MNCIYFLACGILSAPPRGLPARLQKLLDTPCPRTSQIEWSITWVGGYNDGLVERYITRTAGDALWESNLGDERGFHEAKFRQAPVEDPHNGLRSSNPPVGVADEDAWRYEAPREESAGTSNYLIRDGQFWHLSAAERPLSGTLVPLKDAGSYSSWQPVRLHSVGLVPYFAPYLGDGPFRLPREYAEGSESATFHEGYSDGLPTVSAVYNRTRLSWSFDDKRGGQPVRAALYLDGELAWSSETEVQEVAEKWFPKTVRFYRGYSESPYKVIDVQRATFDEPWHMQDITPEDIGVVYGTQFQGPDGPRIWNGVDVIPSSEYWDLVYLYGIWPDRRIIELLADNSLTPDPAKVERHIEFMRNKMKIMRAEYVKKHGKEPWLELATPKAPGEKDEWDVYVEKFIAEHKLPEHAVKLANEVLERAKKIRDVRRMQNSSDIAEAKRKGDSKKLAHYEDVEKRIFDRVLVHNLQKLMPEGKKEEARQSEKPG